ncbi:MAG: PEP-CTERM sorting domain-containing protein [Gammaproteobacteria bacterium]|nr:PEP-CTERM sorting domain-containing protein [Gammaproteobacteria bacterium]
MRTKCHRHNGPRFTSLLGISIALLAAGSARAWVVDQTSTVNFKSTKNYGGVPYTKKTLPLIDNFNPSIPYGGIVGGVGLYAGAGGHADIDLELETWFDNSFDLAAAAKQQTFLFSPNSVSHVGDSFFLVNNIDSLGIQKLNLSSGNLYAGAGLDMTLGGWAKAKACIGFCVSAGIKLNISSNFDLAEISNSGLSVFDNQVDSSSPFQYTDPSGLFSVSANAPTFAKTNVAILPGLGVNTGWMQQPVLTANLDVAELIAKAAGFSIPLEGDLLGFGYELFSLDAYLGLDLRQLIKFQPPTLTTNYNFTAPVQLFDDGTNTWSAPLTQLTLADGQAVELRSAGAANIGITSAPTLNYKIDYDVDFALKAGIDLSALEIHGFGLSLGPLIDPDPWELNLGTLDVDSGTDTGEVAAKAGTINLHFENLVAMPPSYEGGEPIIVDLCAAPAACSSTGYVTTELATGDPDSGLVEQTTRRVFNYGGVDCDDLIQVGCDFDWDFVPVVRQRRSSLVDLPVWFDDTALLAQLTELGLPLPDFGTPLLADIGGDFAEDFALLGEFLAAAAAPDLIDSDDAAMLAALAALGVDTDVPFPPRPPLTGAPYDALNDLTENREGLIAFGVPEPSPVALLTAALPAYLWWRRRRTRHAQR